MDTFTEVVPWPEETTWKARMAWENGAPFQATWAVHVTWAAVDGTVTPVGVDVRSYTTHDDEIRPTAGGLQRVTARGLRDVNVGDVVERSRTQLQARQDVTAFLAGAHAVLHPEDSTEMGQVRARAQELRDAADGKPRRGRPPEVTDDQLQAVAKVYRQAVITGSRKPVRVVAEHFGITDPHDFRPKGWVQAARKRGLID